MIEVYVRQDGITVSGHAGYAEPGKDIICAGATVLMETLVKSLEDLAKDKIEYDISPGRADIHYENLSERGQLLVDSFFLGFCLIAADFPGYVKIF